MAVQGEPDPSSPPRPAVPLPHQPRVAHLTEVRLRFLRAVDRPPLLTDITPAEVHPRPLKRPRVQHPPGAAV